MRIKDLSILLSLGNEAWLIEQRFADRMVPIILRQLSTGNMSLESFRQATAQKLAGHYHGLQSEYIGEYAPTRKVGQVAILPIVGTLTKRGDLCSYGMRDYINEIELLNENQKIDSIVLDIESPGGTVDGTNELGLAVKSSKKPIVSFGDNMVASAAYWIASQSRHIIANSNNPTEMGSIGVLYVHENWSKYIEENIGSVEIMRASQSVDKARVNVIEPLEKEYRKEIQQDLDQLADQFIQVVKEGRADKLDVKAEGLFSGRMFKQTEALKIGLIDTVGTLEDAIGIASSLTKSSNSNPTNKNAMSFKKAVSSFFKPKKAKAAEEEEQPAAAEDTTPMWTADMVFNTDGSGDGAFCIHPDTDGNDRKFETKIDNNQGNEPPTDPGVTEDDNWALVAQESTEEEPADEGNDDGQATTVVKLNAALKKANQRTKSLSSQVTKLTGEVKELKAQLAKKPAGASTTVVSDSDSGHEYDDKKKKFRTSVDDEADEIISLTSKSKKK